MRPAQHALLLSTLIAKHMTTQRNFTCQNKNILHSKPMFVNFSSVIAICESLLLHCSKANNACSCKQQLPSLVLLLIGCSTLYRSALRVVASGRADVSAPHCNMMDAHISTLIASAGFALTTAILWPQIQCLSHQTETHITSLL